MHLVLAHDLIEQLLLRQIEGARSHGPKERR